MTVRLTKKSLEKVGVELVSKEQVQLRCMQCGQSWSPNLKTAGRLPRGWWKCPNDPSHTSMK